MPEPDDRYMEAQALNVEAPAGSAGRAYNLLHRWHLLGRAARDARLSKADIAVLYVVADRINDDGKAWPSVRRIAGDASVNVRTVTRSIGNLSEWNYLIRQSGGYTKSNVYRLGVGEAASRGEAVSSGGAAHTGNAARTGEAVAECGRARPAGMGDGAHVTCPVNLLNESTQETSTAAPLTDDGESGSTTGNSGTPTTTAEQRAARIAVIAAEAMETFNASALTKAHGGLVPNVNPAVGAKTRRKQVGRCIPIARDICKADYGSTIITPGFWRDYWAVCLADDHKSGRQGGGRGYEGWVPEFEFLTRKDVMLAVYTKVASE